MPKPNYILFFPDEMRATSVSCYGNPIVKMPAFDRLAAEGTLFEHCIVQNPVCSPSRCSLMTGWYVHTAGHRSLWHLLRPHEPSLFRYLKNDGYDIRWYGKNDLYSQAYLDEILDNVADLRQGKAPETARPSGKVHGNAPAVGLEDPLYDSCLVPPIPESGEEILLDPCVAQALDFLEARKPGDAPFFLYLPTTMPHPVYNALERFHEMYGADGVASQLMDPEKLSGEPGFAPLIRLYRRIAQWDPQVLSKIYAVYLGMNSYVDYLLGLLMDALDRTGLSDSTVLMVTSDHGDWAGNKGLVEKWPNAMDDDIVRVPLLMKGPGIRAGQRITGQAALFDVMPTVLEMSGIACKHTHFARSLVPELSGARDDRERPVFCEGGYDAHDPWCFESLPRGNGLVETRHLYTPKVVQQKEHPESVCRTAMIRTLTHKLVLRTGGDNELYDLARDPGETRNVYRDPAYEGIARDLRDRLLLWYVETSDVTPWNDDPRGFAP